MSDRLIATERSQDLVTYAVLIDGSELPREIQISQMYVYKEINRIPVAKLVVLDGDVASENFEVSSSDHFIPGREIELQTGYHNDLKTIFKGIITRQNIKIRANGQSALVVDAQDKAVKMTIGKNSRFFYDVKDSDIIEELIDNHTIEKTIQSTDFTHIQMVQYDASDWDFMMARSEANNMLCFVSDGKIEVKKADFSGDAVVDLTFGANLIELDGELDSRTQINTIKAHSWDQGASEIIETEAEVEDFSATGNLSFSDLAGAVSPEEEILRFGGQLPDQELQKLADNQKQRRQLAHLKGRAKFQGIETVLPGTMIRINGVGDRFSGKVFVSGVRHSIHDGDWKTQVQFGLDHELFAQKFNISSLPAGGIIPAVHGLQIGLVSQLEGDPDHEERIMVRVPLINDGEQGIWARVALPDAGNERTVKFLPEIGDEVLIGFINDDPRKAVVLGALHSSKRPSPIPNTDDNHIKGIVSRSKMKVTFDDEKIILTLETPGGHKIILDDDAGAITMEDSNGNKFVMNSDGITLESAIDLILKATGDLKSEGTNVESKASASFKAEGSAGAELKSNATLVVKGSLVQIN